MVFEDRLSRFTKKGLRFVPHVQVRNAIFFELHDAIEHWDFEATCKMVAARFCWPSMRGDVARYVRTCDNCQRRQRQRQYKFPLRQPVSCIFETWSTDFADPLPKTSQGNTFALIAVEYLTGWPSAVALSDSTSH